MSFIEDCKKGIQEYVANYFDNNINAFSRHVGLSQAVIWKFLNKNENITGASLGKIFDSVGISFENIFHTIPSEKIISQINIGPEEQSLDWKLIHSLLVNSNDILGANSIIRQAVSALATGKYVVFIGPPGTGKTAISKAIAKAATETIGLRYRIATATSEWTTFETLGGYLPDKDNPNKLVFNMRLITQAIYNDSWLIIDEINRADIDKAFGELFTLFSGEKVNTVFYTEEGKNIVLLPVDADCDVAFEHPIQLSKNWRLLGTMNTFDKSSLYQLSYAFMRRFAFISLPVPQVKDFQNIILKWYFDLKFHENGFGEQGDSEILKIMMHIFCTENMGLAGINLQVGPAVPIDCLKHVSSYFSIANDKDFLLLDLMLETFDAYLFPQFEGMDERHELIRDSIASALSLDTGHVNKLDTLLAVWTGYVPQRYS